MSPRAGLAALSLLLAAGPAAAQVTVSVNGVFETATLDWSQTRSFTAFLEPARYAASYAADPSAGFDLGIQVSLFSGFGPSLALSRVDRDATARLDATIPHPLYFDRDRTASVDLAGYGYSERAVHAGLGWQGGSGAVGFAVFGGVSLFRVQADAYGDVTFDQSYPFDEVTVRPPRGVSQTSNPTGFHVGGRLDWRVSSHVGIGGQLRFSAATARFSRPTGETFEIDAGGAQLGVGLRVYF